MKMITNYLNSFENYLPEGSREEVRAELEASILGQVEDQENQLGRSLNMQEQEDLLLKIGHPMRVASAYLPNQQLINTDYFPAYKKALEITFIIFGVLTILKFLPLSFTSGSILGSIFHLFWSLIDTAVWVFASVTLVFYLLQKYAVYLDEIYEWSPKQLNHSGKKVSLRRFDTFIEIIFEGLFLVFWNRLYAADSFYVDNELIQNVSMSPDWQSVFWAVNFLVVLSILLSIYKLAFARWSKLALIFNIVLAVASIGLVLYIFQHEALVVVESKDLGGFDWNRIVWIVELNVKIVLGIVAAVSAWDIYSSFKKLTSK